MLKKINRKGFTLVELLVVIAVIALVLGITSFGIIKVLDNSKKKTVKISTEGIVAAGKVYSSEKTNNNSYWRDVPNHEDKYFCVTIEELINKGLIKKDGKLPDNIKINNYVMIKKNKVTSTIGNGEIIANTETDNVCTGTILKEKLKYPSILSSNKYTDKVSINFKDTICEKDCDDFSIDKSKTECLYGDSSGLLNMKGTISGNTCSISGLKSSETYYARICQTTSKGSYVCSTTDGYTTDKVKEPNITIKNVGANINYDTTGISGNATFSFMSTISAFVKDSNGNDIMTAEANKWYNINNNDVTLHFRSNGNGIVYAKTTDSSGNTGESNSKYSVYTISFNKGDADRLEGGATNGIGMSCVAEEKGKCKVKAPSFEKNNFTILGWNTSKTATTSSWSIGDIKEINKSAVYYPVFKSSVKIKYSVNGGTITSATPSDSPTKFWKTTSTGLIQKSSSSNGTYADYYQSIDNNKMIGTDGLVNYNNSNSINISRSCYSAPSGSEWICLSGCTTSNKTFSQASGTNYKSTDFCNTANGNCNVTLGVNWKVITYSISYDANGGSDAPSNQTKNCGTNLILSSTKPTRTGYTFLGWSTSSTATSATYSAGGSYTSNSDAKLYAVWRANVATVKYSTNGGDITSSTINSGTTYKWSRDLNTNNGLISRSNANGSTMSIYAHKFERGATAEDLKNYNSSTYIYITKANSVAVSGAEWKCLSENCTQTTYSQVTNYGSSDFCDTSKGDCTVVLGVNWTSKVYTITLDKQSGSGGTSSIYEKYGSNFSLDSSGSPKMLTDTNPIAKPTRKGYTFDGYYTEKDGGGSQIISASGYIKSGMYSTFTSNSTIYAKWRINKVYIRYNTNGGSIATTSNDSGTWGKDSSGRVTHNGSLFEYTINYGSSNDLHNWNNKSGINISKSNYTAVSGAEWICKSGCTSGKKYNHSTSYASTEFCDASNGDCTVEVQVNWRLNQVHVRYNTNGGTVVSNSNGWSKNSDNYMLKDGSLFEQIINYGSSTDPYNYNSSSYINITRSGYKAVSGSEWICTSGCSEDKKVFNHGTSYASTTYCNASKADCTVVFKVNWVQDCTTYYVIEPDGLNCRNGASTSYGIKTVFTCGSSLRVCSSATNGWYYDSNKGCYVSGKYISKSRPSSCAQTGGGSTVSCSSYKYCYSNNRIGDDSCMSYSNFAGSSAGACFIYNPCNCPSGFSGTNSCEDRTGHGGC